MNATVSCRFILGAYESVNSFACGGKTEHTRRNCTKFRGPAIRLSGFMHTDVYRLVQKPLHMACSYALTVKCLLRHPVYNSREVRRFHGSDYEQIPVRMKISANIYAINRNSIFATDKICMLVWTAD